MSNMIMLLKTCYQEVVKTCKHNQQNMIMLLNTGYQEGVKTCKHNQHYKLLSKIY